MTLAADTLGPLLPMTCSRWNERSTPAFDPSQLTMLLRRIAPITLAQMDSVALQSRIDTKYVMTQDHLYRVLTVLAEQYWMLEVEGRRRNHYRSLYFDTPEHTFYRAHHAGRRNRYKVRSREYVDTGLTFLEVKFKTGRNRTIKYRARTSGMVTALTSTAGEFVESYVGSVVQRLEPMLWIEYSRITLVSQERRERVTLDVNLQFYTDDRVVTLPGLVIAEVKEERSTRSSAFTQVMYGHHLRSCSFSKYCMGLSLVYPATKQNNFKPIHRLLTKLLQGDSHHAY